MDTRYTKSKLEKLTEEEKQAWLAEWKLNKELAFWRKELLILHKQKVWGTFYTYEDV